MPPPFPLSCFISGLSPEIYREVQALQLLTLVQAVRLARLQEEKILDNRRTFRGRGVSFSSTTSTTIPPLVPLSPPPLLPTLSKPLPPVPLKRLTPEELASRCEHGLCFTCEEKVPLWP